MKRRYLDVSSASGSGITEVDESMPGAITVWYGAKGYEYTDANSGAQHVQEMKVIAAGNGHLSTYINQNKASLKPRKL